MYKGEFFFSCPVLSTKQAISLKEMTVEEYISLLKFLKNNNSKDIEFYIEFLLRRLIVNESCKLNVLDKFIILLTLRSTILGSEAYIMQTSNNMRLKISIDDILSSLFSIKLIEPQRIQMDNLRITLDYPRNFYTQDDDVFENYILDINDICFSEITKEEQQAILNHLPSNILKPIQTHILTLDEKLQECVLFKTPGLDITINLQNDTLLQLLKILLSDDLKSIYDMAFILISKAHFSWSDIMLLNPAEMRIFYNKLIEENKEMQKNMTQPQSPIKAVVDSMK